LRRTRSRPNSVVTYRISQLIEQLGGHGSASLTKALEVTADEYAFTCANVGVTPRFSTIVP